MKTLFSLLILLVILTACNLPASQVPAMLTPQITIVVAQATPPPPCQLAPGEVLSISLSGVVPISARVNWRVHGGGTIADSNALATIYTAPIDANGPVEIIATVYYNDSVWETQQECLIQPLAGQEEVVKPSDTPVETPIAEDPPTPAVVTISPSPVAEVGSDYTVAITEIMANPCGKGDEERANEYIELYNYGTKAVDLAGLYLIATNQEENDHPDSIVAWQTRNSVPAGFKELATDTTILPPGAYALIMEPSYHLIASGSVMPYAIPPGTVILTMAKKNRLGNGVGGLISLGNSRDSLYLYKGSPTRVEQPIISSYAIRNAGPYPYGFTRPSGLPLEAGDCKAIQRKTVPGEDKADNWEVIEAGTPGSGPY